jgi:nucleoside-diphosphate kinase
MKTYSALILKPGHVSKLEELKKILEKNQIKIDTFSNVILGLPQVERHYEEHYGKKFYDGLVEYMTTGNVKGIKKFKPNCIIMVATSAIEDENEEEFITRSRQVVKEKIRPELCFKREEFPKLSDEDFKELTMTANVLHASDSPESAKREIKNLFPKYFAENERTFN